MNPDLLYNATLLSVWSIGGGEVRFQTSSPAIAKNLSLRRGFRQVAYGVARTYLRIFSAHLSMVRAIKLVRKLTCRFEPKSNQSQPITGVLIDRMGSFVPRTQAKGLSVPSEQSFEANLIKPILDADFERIVSSTPKNI